MADVSEIAKLDSEKLEKIQSVISLFHLLGLTDKDIENLVNIAKGWPTIVKNMNAFSEELDRLSRIAGNKKDTTSSIQESMAKMVGFDSHAENIIPKGDGDK